MTAIALAGVSKAFGPVRALEGIALDVAPGELLTLLGPSGCGKTVLLRIIAGLERPDAGTVAFDGQDVTHAPARDRGVGLVSAGRVIEPYARPTPSLWSLLRRPRPAGTPGNRVAQGAPAPAPDTAARLAAIHDALGAEVADQLQRAGRSARPARAGSGQESPHLGVARCLARGARVLLLDAPLAYLDAARRAEVRALTVGLLQRAGTTSIYATHDRAEAAAVGGRVAVMRGGRIEQVGRYEDLHRRPATTFVAGFVGVPAINLLAGVVVPEGLRLAPAAVGPPGSAPASPWTISLPPLPPAIAAQVPPGTPLTVGIRAEAFRLAPDGDEGLPARVVDGGRPLGHERYLVTCALGTPAAPGPEIVAELRVPAGQALPVDAPLRLAVDSGQVHLFDAAGNCIDALDAHHTGDAAAPRVPGAGLRA